MIARTSSPNTRHQRAPSAALVRGMAVGLRRPVLVLAVFAGVLTTNASADIGGGHSFGGGGGGGGGGGWGGGDGDDIGWLVYLLLRLCFHYPVVGIPLLIGVVVVWFKFRGMNGAQFRSGGGTRARTRHSVRTRRKSTDWSALRQEDPNFSRPLFEDFLRLLFVRFHEARGSDDLDSVRPYLGETLTLPPRGDLEAITEIVLGSVELGGIQLGSRTSVTLSVTAALTEKRSSGEVRRFRVEETLVLGRARGVLSQGPDRMRVLGCPSCGSSLELSKEGRCRHCEQVVTDGRFGWQIDSWRRVRREMFAEDANLAYHAPTRKHRPPSIVDPALPARRRELAVEDPEFSWSAFEAMVRRTYFALARAWSTAEWEAARPYETDTLFDRHRFWIERYRKQGLRNRMEEIEIQRVQVCRIEQDAFLDSITVRLFIAALDYTVREPSGEVLGGSDRVKREFSVYWTFVRRTGRGEVKSKEPGTCPSCAAPLQVNMAGSCEYCGAHLTSGEFDWVLAAIDQE